MPIHPAIPQGAPIARYRDLMRLRVRVMHVQIHPFLWGFSRQRRRYRERETGDFDAPPASTMLTATGNGSKHDYGPSHGRAAHES
ncbi:hypothetical protein C2E31_19970 [Rhodopirellula baltica]|nr:hypothetical protein C2E31_19970 [Rhodopirellula baltica]